MNIRFRHLQGFLAAARHKSFTIAAHESAMTQPSFSQLVRELETEVKLRLFDRTTRRVELTEAGREFLSSVEGPLAQIVDAYVRMHDMAAGRSGRLIFASVAYDFVMRAL